jgi:hypothetical protein
VAGAERRERLDGVARPALLVERAGVLEACLSLALVMPAAGRAAGAAGAGGATDGAGMGAAAALPAEELGEAPVAAAGAGGGTAAGGAGGDAAAVGGGLAGVAAAGAELAAGLELLRVREVRLAIAQVGRGWRRSVTREVAPRWNRERLSHPVPRSR